MILISNNPTLYREVLSQYEEGSIQSKIINILNESEFTYRYDSSMQFKFELDLRNYIAEAARKLNSSGFGFAIFRKSRCNEDFWIRTSEGGFLLRENAIPSEAIMDIYNNGRLYATECATAMVIVYYRALLYIYKEDLFNKLFKRIHLMNWHYIDRNLREIGYMYKEEDYLPGDRRYIANPDVDPLTMELQGENVIDMGGGLYYGHGVGITTAERIIYFLNQNRREDATVSAYLMDSAARPDFKRLYRLSL